MDPGEESAEPLADSAQLALQLAQRYCQGCDWYHGAWQYLRLAGVTASFDACKPFLQRVLSDLAARSGFERILISGSADYAMLAAILHAWDVSAHRPITTMVDICRTPLELNAWYANRRSVALSTYQADIRSFRPDEHFDLICTHSFLGLFDAADRQRVVASWARSLRPGGLVVTTQRIRPDAIDDRVAYSREQVQAFEARAKERAQSMGDLPGLPAAALAPLARAYAEHKQTFVIRSAGELRALFERNGFAVEEQEQSGAAEHATDRLAGPPDISSERIRIVARKLR
jgi:SAM-dependent methyltransferase